MTGYRRRARRKSVNAEVDKTREHTKIRQTRGTAANAQPSTPSPFTNIAGEPLFACRFQQEVNFFHNQSSLAGHPLFKLTNDRLRPCKTQSLRGIFMIFRMSRKQRSVSPLYCKKKEKAQTWMFEDAYGSPLRLPVEAAEHPAAGGMAPAGWHWR